MIEEQPLPWPELIETLYRRRIVILGVLAIGLLIPSMMAILEPPTYRVRAKILLAAQAMSGPRSAAMSETQIKSEIALLRSTSLISSVLASEAYRTEDEKPQSFWTKLRRGLASPLASLKRIVKQESAKERLNRRITAISQQLTAHPIASSNMIQVSLYHGQPAWAAQFVNDLLTHHIERIVELNEQSNARSFFQRQKNLLAQELEEARVALTAYRERLGPELLSGDQVQLRQLLTRLEGARVDSETQLLELEARVDFLTEELLTLPETIDSESRITENEEVKFLNSRILQLEIERSELLSRFTPTSTRVSEIDRQIEEARRLLATKERDTLAEVMKAVNPAHQTLNLELVQARSRLASLRARLGALDTQVDHYRLRLSDLERSSAELQRLEDELETKNEAYAGNLRKEEAARQSRALDESGIVNLTVVEPATVPPGPEPTKAFNNISIGGALGLILGIALAFIKDWLDPAVKSSLQARRLSALPVIAEVPRR